MGARIQKLPKPEIRLDGEAVGDLLGEWIDHSVTRKDGGLTIRGPDKSKFLTLRAPVSVIFNIPSEYPLFTYTNPDFKNTFTGTKRYVNHSDLFNYATIFFTINGKDPIRSKKYLYQDNHLVLNEKVYNPSVAAVVTREYIYDGKGFEIGSPPGGADQVRLKARMYYRGDWSDVAVARFNIARSAPQVVHGNDFFKQT